MHAIQFKNEYCTLNKGEPEASWPGDPGASSLGAVLLQLGRVLADAAFGDPTAGLCSRCGTSWNPQRSTARFPTVFCSERCEQEFIHIALASLSLQDCIRMQKRLDALLVGTIEVDQRARAIQQTAAGTSLPTSDPELQESALAGAGRNSS
jgi:hypothetical protein